MARERRRREIGACCDGCRALSRQAQVASRPIPRMSWDPIELLDEQREELRLLFLPQFTMAKVNDDQIAHCVALLFLKSIGTASPRDPIKAEDPRSDFGRLAEAMLLWCINSLGKVVNSAQEIKRCVSQWRIWRAFIGC